MLSIYDMLDIFLLINEISWKERRIYVCSSLNIASQQEGRNWFDLFKFLNRFVLIYKLG